MLFPRDPVYRERCAGQRSVNPTSLHTGLPSSFFSFLPCKWLSHRSTKFSYPWYHRVYLVPQPYFFYCARWSNRYLSAVVPECLTCPGWQFAPSYFTMPPKGAKGGKSKVSEAITVETKVFQTRSAKAGLQVCYVPLARLYMY